jgi:hypothetical protein
MCVSDQTQGCENRSAPINTAQLSIPLYAGDQNDTLDGNTG